MMHLGCQISCIWGVQFHAFRMSDFVYLEVMIHVVLLVYILLLQLVEYGHMPEMLELGRIGSMDRRARFRYHGNHHFWTYSVNSMIWTTRCLVSALSALSAITVFCSTVCNTVYMAYPLYTR